MTKDGADLQQLLAQVTELPLAKAIILSRLNPLGESATLASVGDEHGVTRERVRQVQVRLEAMLDAATADPAILAVAGRFRDHFGLAVRRGTTAPPVIATAMVEAGWDSQLAVVVAIAGTGWTQAGEWCLHPDVPPLPASADPDQMQRLVAHLGLLLGPGLAEQVVAGAVAKKSRPDPDIGDLIELVLAGAHRPLTAEEIAPHDTGGRSVRYIDNVLAGDERFVRLTRDGYGLLSWGLPPYLGVADAMLRAIDAGRGQSRLIDLMRDLHAQYGHAEASVSMYASQALIFELSGGWVRRRPAERFGEAVVAPEDDPKCTRDSEGRWSVAFPIGHDLTRGSGLAVPRGFAFVVGCEPGGETSVPDDTGQPVPFTWSPKSTGGPAIGSLRSIAERIGGETGALLVVAWDEEAGVLRPSTAVPNDDG